MQNQQKNWGDIMRLHAHVQKQREDFEHQLHRERQARYKEELDNLMAEKQISKKQERNVDVELRKRIESDYDRYRQQAAINKTTMKDMHSLFSEDNIRDHYSKLEHEKQIKHREAMGQLERANALKELDRLENLKVKEEKYALSNVQQRVLEDDKHFKQYKEEREKVSDKQYMNEYTRALDNQDINRKKFFEDIRNRGQNHEVMEHYKHYTSEENKRRQEYEKNVIEKARVEKLRKEEDVIRKKQFEQERMKNETLHALNYQMQSKKDMEHLKRQQELDLENKQLHENIDKYDSKVKAKKEYQEQVKHQHVEALNRQLEDLRSRKNNKDMLTPLEEKLNRNDINILENRANVNLFTSPSFVPGRNLGFERKLQNHYINKALSIHNPLAEAPRSHHRDPHQDNGSIFPATSERAQSQQQLQSVAKQTLTQPYEIQPQAMPRANSPLELQQPKYNAPELPNQRYTPQYVSNNQPSDPRERGSDDRNIGVAFTPQVNNRIRPSNQSDDYNNQVFRSMQDLQPNPTIDYRYIRSKNGIHGNAVNIISNELKAPSAYLRNPYALH